MEEKLIALYKWREYANPNGYRYVLDQNAYGDEIVRFERY